MNVTPQAIDAGSGSERDPTPAARRLPGHRRGRAPRWRTAARRRGRALARVGGATRAVGADRPAVRAAEARAACRGVGAGDRRARAGRGALGAGHGRCGGAGALSCAVAGGGWSAGGACRAAAASCCGPRGDGSPARRDSCRGRHSPTRTAPGAHPGAELAPRSPASPGGPRPAREPACCDTTAAIGARCTDARSPPAVGACHTHTNHPAGCLAGYRVRVRAMSTGRPRARVTLERRRLWTVRASLVLGRWLVYALALAAIVTAVRAAAGPRPPARRAGAPRRKASGIAFRPDRRAGSMAPAERIRRVVSRAAGVAALLVVVVLAGDRRRGGGRDERRRRSRARRARRAAPGARSPSA